MIPEAGTSFPVGLIVLFFIILVTISGLFAHWCDVKTRLSQHSSPPDSAGDGGGSQYEDSFSHSITIVEIKENDERFAVEMPGEEAPRYLAVPVPRTNIQIQSLK